MSHKAHLCCEHQSPMGRQTASGDLSLRHAPPLRTLCLPTGAPPASRHPWASRHPGGVSQTPRKSGALLEYLHTFMSITLEWGLEARAGERRAKRARAHGGSDLQLAHAPRAAHCPQLPTEPLSVATIGLHGCPEVVGGHGRACMELFAHKTVLRAHALRPCAPQRPWFATILGACLLLVLRWRVEWSAQCALRLLHASH